MYANVVPTGAVMPFNLDACSTGWSPAGGQDGRPDLRGRFPLGVGDLPQGTSTMSRGDQGGSNRLRVQISEITVGGGASEPGVVGIGVEWDGEIPATILHDGAGGWVWRSSSYADHLPPYAGLLYCVKD